MADWSELPRELLEEILTHFNSSIDASRFTSVCSSWRHLSPSEFNFNGEKNFPLCFNGISVCKRSILLLSPPQIPIPDSPHNPTSWIIKVEEKGPKRFRIYFPLSWSQLPLPFNFPRVMDLSNIRIRDIASEYFLCYTDNTSEFLNLLMEKVAYLSRSNNSDDFYLLTIYVSGKLALFNNLRNRWHVISDKVDLPYDDVIAFNGEFYSVDYTGRTVLVGVDDVDTLKLVAKPVCGGDKKRLVEIDGELMLVDVYFGLPPWENFSNRRKMEDLDECVASRSFWFKVYRLEWEGMNWVEVKDLGNYVLFLGMYSSFSVLAADILMEKGNCIYFAFTDNFYPSHFNEANDVFKFHCGGVFNLEDSSITYSNSFWPPPHWIKPCF
ncbi:F-box protein SKIP23-like [Amaranthus tricolor]|uniref:F-box protein SKIP23-like n=1 Tax=Amaranthus tricolor TaxID=29722 RepID=UPI00258F5296|nr:F-box protein SKIP23-like [Amaranthus tricolor]XP_057525810.1 F-box protein SKIP23-like [Amaranthus tricolor]XP_057525811.1 F-box protein SKIP23-like [Amaranthus tricolor]